MINRFDGAYYFLSNYYMAPVLYNNVWYTNNEAAFHAQKNLKESHKFTTLHPSVAKRYGRQVQLRSDWEEVKDQIMYEICLAKFQQNSNLAEMLLATGDEELVEGTDGWNDTYWGVAHGVGQNKLGKILMRVRAELQET